MGSVQLEHVERGTGRWSALETVIENLDQTAWVDFRAAWHRSEHFLVALDADRIVGFLRYVVQPIGPELDREAFILDGQPLLEAKVVAFGVVPERRRQGIGRALQQRLIAEARGQGLYQIRSHSSGHNSENHRLKLALGYAVVPIVRGEDKHGAYFVLPLIPGGAGP